MAPWFEVEIRQVSTAYVLVEAEDLTDARNRALGEGIEQSTFIEQQEIIDAQPYDDRFSDYEDSNESVEDYVFGDEYEVEQEETDE